MNPATLSLAKCLGLGQLSWSESRAWGKAREWEKKRDWEREGVRESFGWAVCRRGDSWWQRRIRGWREGGIDVVLSHRPPLWPRRSGLRTGRLTKASEAARRKTRCKQLPHAVVSRQASLEDRDQSDYPAWGIGEEGEEVCGVSGTYSPSFRPVNQGTTSQIRSSGGGVETNSCQETTGDPATAAVWPRLRRSTRGAY